MSAPRDVRRIHVHKPDHLGDAVLARPALAMLRAAYPDAAIVLACHPAAAELFADDPLRLTAEPWDSPLLGGADSWFAYVRRVRRFRPDLVVNLRHDLRDILLCHALGRRHLVTYNHRGLARLARHPGPPPREDRAEADNHVALLTATLGLAPVPTPPLAWPADDDARAAAAWADAPGDGPAIALHAAARTPAKLWPVAHWRALITIWARDGNPKLALLGGPDDGPLNAAIARDLPVADWTGRFTLRQTAAVLAAADVLVGVDSGPGHLARAVGTPVISLMSGTNSAARWAPDPATALRVAVDCAPCRLAVCPVAGHPCLRNIEPAQVPAALAQIERR